jgi:hypothetical protein
MGVCVCISPSSPSAVVAYVPARLKEGTVGAGGGVFISPSSPSSVVAYVPARVERFQHACTRVSSRSVCVEANSRI